MDTAGNLYVAEWDDVSGRIEKRDAQGNWSVIATYGEAPAQVAGPTTLAVDAAGNLYVADSGNNRVQEYTASNGQ
jgi:DNA-binding beta-propeller fold protein YncE